MLRRNGKGDEELVDVRLLRNIWWVSRPCFSLLATDFLVFYELQKKKLICTRSSYYYPQIYACTSDL